MITFTAYMQSPHENVLVAGEGQEATLLGVSSKHEGVKGKVRFQGRLTAQASGGRVTQKNGIVSVVGADEATIYVTVGTNVVSYKDISGDEVAQSKERLHAAVALGYQQLKARHEKLYHQYYDRVRLNLGEDIYSNVPTDKRIEQFAKVAHSQSDNYLVATYFQFGRYLLISSSQPDNINPANLQGLWNDKLFPAWDSKYTTNINLEMNYWPSEVTNLTELNGPLFRLIREISETGRKTAKDMYGADGWVSHHNTDQWRVTGPIDHAPSDYGPQVQGGYVVICGSIISILVMWTSSAVPILSCWKLPVLYSQILVRHPQNNWLVICPGESPEHGGKGRPTPLDAGVTMDNQILFELYSNVLAAADIIGAKDTTGTIETIKKQLPQLPPMQIGRWGQLQEWLDDLDDPKDNHRHFSHLYGLYPSNQISPYRTPELSRLPRPL